MYDCDADHEDELSFVEGEIIVMVREADPDWWVSNDQLHLFIFNFVPFISSSALSSSPSRVPSVG